MNLNVEKWIVFIIFIGLLSCDSSPAGVKQEKEKSNKSVKPTTGIVTYKADKEAVTPDYNRDEWDEITYSDDSVILDLRYAQTNNFVKKKLYNCPRCFLRPDIAKKLISVNRELLKKGYKLKIFDCYRPRPVQEELWKMVPDEDYVAAPWKGSMHNRGLAIDLTLADENNKELDMGTTFDFFGEEAHFTYIDFPAEILANRQLLKTTMEKYGFRSIRTEWWHYSVTTVSYPISDWQWQCN